MSLLNNFSLKGLGKIAFMVIGLVVIVGLLLAACSSSGGLSALRSVGRSGGIPTSTPGAIPPAAPAPAAQAAPAQPAPAQPAAPAPAAPAPAQPAPAQPAAAVPTVQPVIVSEAGEIRVQTDGSGQARQVAPAPQDGISPAPVIDAAPANADPNLVCDQRINHTVAPGDNIFRLAVRYRTTTASIARLNGISNVRKLSVGRGLAIQTCDRAGGLVSGGGGGGTGAGRRYVVRAGDNLFRIGVRFGTTAEHIRAANGLSGYNIAPGQVLVIP
jgi:LysM repeat protein